MKRFFKVIWHLILEPLWLLATAPFDEDTSAPCLMIKDFGLDACIPELPCLTARVVWKDGGTWDVCSLDGVHWFREPEFTEVQGPARTALVRFYAVCCEITTYIEEAR